MCKIEYKLVELIALFEYLVYVENFNAHKKILSQYKKVLGNINGKDTEEIISEDFMPLTTIFRLYFEAIPSDDKLGKYIVNKMESFYDEIKFFQNTQNM